MIRIFRVRQNELRPVVMSILYAVQHRTLIGFYNFIVNSESYKNNLLQYINLRPDFP